MLPVLVLALALQRSPADCSRRALLRRAATAGLANAAALTGGPARAIVNGDVVSDAEAAATGSVGLWIDLSGCSVCRKDKPATCSGTLVAPTLVLSARHCLDTPRMLNGTLERVVFGSDMFGAGASRDVVAVKSTSDYGIETAGNDLLLDAGSDPTLERSFSEVLGCIQLHSLYSCASQPRDALCTAHAVSRPDLPRLVRAGSPPPQAVQPSSERVEGGRASSRPAPLHSAAVDRAAAVRRGAVRRPAPLQGGAGGGEEEGLSLLPGRARLPLPGNLRLRPAGVRRNCPCPKL